MPAANTPESLDRLPPEIVATIQRRQAALREQLRTLLPPGEPITLELGCGHGHYLTAYAEAHPEEVCLGVDLVSKRIEKARAKARKRDLARLFFVKADVREAIAALPPEASLGRVLMLFPDPWPKVRHAKKRMLQPALLDLLASRCPAQTPFYLRTDEPILFQWAQEVIEGHPAWTIDPAAAWSYEADSYFQNLMTSWQSLVARRQ